jgi:hypothetical protein
VTSGWGGDRRVSQSQQRTGAHGGLGLLAWRALGQ